MRVLIKEPNEMSYLTDIPNTLESLQQIVGGYIEVVRGKHGSLIICNEEGKLLGLKPNFHMFYDMICGTVVIVGDCGEEFGDVPEEAKTYYEAIFGAEEER